VLVHDAARCLLRPEWVDVLIDACRHDAVGGLLAQPIADLTLTYGSKSYFQAHADLGKRFGSEKRLGVRFNGVYGDGEMGAKDESQKRQVGALGLDYIGDRARLSFDLYNSVNKIDGGSPGMFNFLGNAFLVKDGVLLAPPKDHLMLPGITYDVILEMAAAEAIPHEVRRIEKAEVFAADELLLTSSTREVLAITELDSQPVGNGRPGPMFARLHQLYQDFKRNVMRK